MFTYPATEIFNADGERRVVWSDEEYNGALAAGWLTTKPEPKPKAAPLTRQKADKPEAA